MRKCCKMGELIKRGKVGGIASMDIMTKLKNNVLGKGVKIVFPEGSEPRIVQAASLLARGNMVKPILIGNAEAIKKAATDFDLTDCDIIDPAQYDQIDAMVAALVDIRKGKLDEAGAREWLTNVNYFGTMLVQMGLVDGLVSGAIHTTGDTIRPALQIIKTKPGVSKTFGYYALLKEAAREQRTFIFADCAVNPDPSSSDLAEFAVESAEAARMFGIEPKVALLSFSSHGSAKTASTEKVAAAKQILDDMANLSFDYDGELQFDAALVEHVGKLKAPTSSVAGQANVFVFPDLNAGNIGYKIAQRLGGYEAIGPILAGLNKPVNDLSRGCSVQDVCSTAIITANQALMQ